MFGTVTSTPWFAAMSTRTAVFIAAWVGLVVAPVTAPPWQAFPHDLYVDGFARFDTSWYQSIWEYGYSYEAGAPSNVNFFPLYALVAGIVAQPLELWMSPLQAFCLAGAIVSHVAFALALVAVHRIAARRCGAAAAVRAVWLVASFPFALFFSAVYSESTYLCLAAWAFERAEARRWGTANLLAAACVLARVPGILVGLGLGLEYLRAQRGRPDRRVLWFGLPLAAAAALAAYFHLRFGDALIFKTTQIEAWGREPGVEHLVRGVRRIAGAGPADARVLTAMYLASIPAFAALAVLAFRRLGPGYGAFTAIAFALAVSTGLDGLGRYEAVLFPAFIVAACSLRRAGFAVAVAAGLVAQLWLLFLFTHWRLVT